MSALVRDVTEADFATVVVEGSRTRPVVVDFWAEWCGPCKQLSPALEAAAAEFAGEVDVVKVDVDRNQRLAAQFRIQGIPAVKAFSGGQVVAEFTGLQPPAAITQFFAGLAPSPADKLVASAGEDPAQAEVRYREALVIQADHPGAAVGLAELLRDRGDLDDAATVLAAARPTPEVQQMQASLNLAGELADLDALAAAVDSGDAQAAITYGKALAAAGQHDRAIEVLLDAVRRPATRDGAREALIDVFTVLGNDDARVKAARPKLAAALF